MKKFLSLLALMLVTSIGAWAADFTPKTVEGNTVYYYTLKCQASDHDGFIGLTENSFNGRSAVGTLFAFEPTGTDGQYYIKSVVRGKYLNAESGVTFDATPTTYWTIGASGSNIFLYANGDNTKYLNNNITSGVCLQAVNKNGGCSQWTPTEYSYTLPTVANDAKLYRFKNKASNNYMAVNTNGGLVIADKAENNTQWFYTINTGTDNQFYFASAVDGRTAKETNTSTQFTVGYGLNKAFVIDEHKIESTTYVGIRQADRSATSNNSSMHRSYSNVVAWNSETTTEASMWIMEEVPESELGGQTIASIIAKAMLNASTIGIEEEFSCLRSTIETELVKEIVIGMPVQSVRNSLQAANNNATATADYETLKAAYSAYKTSNRLYLPTGYYYMKNMDAGNLGYAYNDYNHEGNTEHKTLMTSTTGANNTIWKVVNNGTTIDIVNGDGKGIKHSTLYSTLNFGNYNATQFDSWGAYIYFTEGLHASNQSHLKLSDGTLFLTPWAHSDSRGSSWKFEPVDISNIYNVVVKGAEAYVTYNGQYAFNGGFFNAGSIEKSEIDAADVTGFNKSVNINGNTITVTYIDASLDLSESKQYIIKNPAANKYLAANLGSADEAGAEKFLKLATGEMATVAEGEYDCFKLFSVGNLAYVGKSSADQNLTTEGAKKFGLVNAAADAVTFIYVGDDIIPVVDGTASEKAWNWHGGAAANNPVGLYTTGDSYSRWEFINIVDAAKVALNSAINNNYKPHIGNGLNQYAATSAYTTAIANGNTIYNSNNTTVAAVNEATAAINSAIAGLQINQPAAGSFIRVRSVKSGMGYVNAEASTAHTNALKVGSKGTSSIYYYDGTHLLAYCNGQYLVKNNDGSGFLALGAVGTDGCAIAFEKTSARLGAYAVKYAGYRYLYAADNASNTDAGSSAANDGYTFWLEQVESLPVALTQVGDLAYASFNAPVAVKVPEDVTAYGAEINGNVLVLSEFSGGNLTANTPVILTTSTGGTYNFNIVESGVECNSHLLGTIAKQNVADGKTTYVLNKSGDKIGFYKSKTFINGFKAYCEVDNNNAHSNALSFRFDDVLTAIEAVESENSGAEIYDLQGRRLNKAQKGMNIINGHKVLVK